MSLIQCNNLTKNYANKCALNHINLSVDAGHPIALVGPCLLYTSDAADE